MTMKSWSDEGGMLSAYLSNKPSSTGYLKIGIILWEDLGDSSTPL
jgi:hypothetical protein